MELLGVNNSVFVIQGCTMLNNELQCNLGLMLNKINDWNFRTVYDSDGHKMFMEKLEESIQQHDKEIEKMCNFHYQGFIESVNELLNVKGDTKKLKVQYVFVKPDG